MEGLTRLMESEVELGDYKGFHFGENDSLDILHFADKTIKFSEDRNKNLWGLKAIFRGFELMLGLRVNLYKSNIYGINLSDGTLDFTSSFLACGIGVFPFEFLGVMAGGQSYEGGNVERVLNAIPLYSLSFYQAPKKVIKEIIGIQRRFHVEGVEGERCINWWKWQTLTEENAAWSNLLKYRHSNLAFKMYVNYGIVISKGDSIWWRDIILINDCDGSKGLSASELFLCRANNGENLSFWFSRPLGEFELGLGFRQLVGSGGRTKSLYVIVHDKYAARVSIGADCQGCVLLIY
ncbi:uncharacterized protein LOC131658901 [Vicia villosa]|uniref:uncharacterized protein LOC131658901 n=1 Tax=Vicia villosa TaxID=3911 RepID=UPI00273C6FFD|nr:uncharacterized protein LOC131658901 [Vicia villosa]